MSVIIKGMKMPQNCWDCPLVNTSPCACKGYSTAIEHTKNRHPDCPLFDADALINIINQSITEQSITEQEKVLDSRQRRRKMNKTMMFICLSIMVICDIITIICLLMR